MTGTYSCLPKHADQASEFLPQSLATVHLCEQSVTFQAPLLEKWAAVNCVSSQHPRQLGDGLHYPREG